MTQRSAHSPSAPHPESVHAPLAGKRPYSPPSVETLGAIEAVTWGPVQGGGNLDQLYGGTGGFRELDGTS